MASVQAFGDLAFRTVSPDEIALMAYYALKCGDDNQDLVEATKVRALVRNLLPVFAVPQIAVLVTALTTVSDAAWVDFRTELLEHTL